MADNLTEATVKKTGIRRFLASIGSHFAETPFLAWLVGALAAVLLERLIGLPFARLLGMQKITRSEQAAE